ncbi:MAG: histidine kinase [Steroidobacteraceae bacterium]
MNQTASTLASNRALYALWALFWLLMIVVSVEDHRTDSGIRWWEPLLWEGSSCLVATVWLVIGRRASARWTEDLANPIRWFARLLIWLPVVALTFIVAIYAIRHGVYALTNEVYEHPGWAFIFFYESIKLVLFTSLWLCIIFGLDSFVLWRRERERLLALQKHLAESQLAQLRAQLQPHFLFNTLNTISSLMQVDVPRADKLLTQLADLLRASLQMHAQHTTTLREELKVLELYALIMQERFIERVNVGWSIADDALDATIPALLLQPLLENAFKHGVENISTSVVININVQRMGDELLVAICNSGALPLASKSGIGLSNCRERLELLFGAKARLDLFAANGLVTARVVIPFKGSAA